MAAAASDKARFFMEQSVPELQEYSRKGIFTSAEITAIAQKRSEFEHIINMPGRATPTDFARYVTYEMNLDTLRKKRSRRLGVKSTTYTGQKKIFFVLERGVRKFQGDMGLWMQYLEYCQQEEASKKLAKGLTQCLRLHPLRWELWVWAARHYVEQQADMTTGRSYMQRGLRFCKNERNLWLQYAKLEMIYVAKIATRRKILGLDRIRATRSVESSNDPNADMIALPDITAEDINPELKKDTDTVDDAALQKLSTSPALSGAIPLTIMNTAFTNFNMDPIVAESFFELFVDFANIPCTGILLDRAESLLQSVSEKPRAQASLAYCEARRLLLNVEPLTPAFPSALGVALQRLKGANTASMSDEVHLASRAVLLLLPYVEHRAHFDEGVLKVLEASVKRNVKMLTSCKSGGGYRGPDPVLELTKRLQRERKVDQRLLRLYGLATQGDG